MAAQYWTRADLIGSGLRRTDIDAAVSHGRLLRARRDRYVDPTADPALIEAACVGGRLACLSLLQHLGVFVLGNSALHVAVPANAARLGSLTPESTSSSQIRLHWGSGPGERLPQQLAETVIDALCHAVHCQPPRATVASIDSAVHLGLLAPDDLATLFGALPVRYRVLRRLVDGRAESGPETLMRLLLRGVGRTVEIQVRISGVGRVDLLVDGWLVIECDSDAHHAGPDAHRVDRTRDLELAARGYTTLRPLASDIMWHPERVLAGVRGLLAARRPRRA